MKSHNKQNTLINHFGILFIHYLPKFLNPLIKIRKSLVKW